MADDVPAIHFGLWLRERRKEYGYTQEQLAALAACSVVTVRRIEEGVRRPSEQLAGLLIEALGVPREEQAVLIRLARLAPTRRPIAASGTEPLSYARSDSPPPLHNLPRQLTSFIGREKELADICALLRHDVPLLTLTGAGGSGKTRLALQAAAQLLPDFPAGTYFVNLAPITDPSLVVHVIAQTVGVKEVPGQPVVNALQDYLQEKRVLLLLDNFEQVAPAGPEVGELLATCPGLKVLVTSRISLWIRGEREYFVPPLQLPDADHMGFPARVTFRELSRNHAVRLFVDRTQAIKADFELTSENAQVVAEICMRLDGLPLAIELAAGRIRSLSPQLMLGRLQERLKMLTGGRKDIPARQQTLRNTIDWSHDLLDPEEKQLFRRVAIFTGGCTLEAVEAVCEYPPQRVTQNSAEQDTLHSVDVLDGLQSLISKNLLQQREGSGKEPRFWMLETIHEYAREKLLESGEAEELTRKHALYFVRMAEEGDQELRGRNQVKWLGMLADDLDNIRAALTWAVEKRESDIALRLAAALCLFHEMRGRIRERREQLERTLGIGDPSDPGHRSRARARALLGISRLALQQGDYTQAHEWGEEALTIAREIESAGRDGRSNQGSRQGQGQDSRQNELRSKKGQGSLQGSGDRAIVAAALRNLGGVATEQGEFEVAHSLLMESLALSRQVDDKWEAAQALLTLGYMADRTGDVDRARKRQYTEQAVELTRAIGDKWGVARTLTNLGAVVRGAFGDYAAARAMAEEARSIQKELGDKSGHALSLANLGYLAFHLGDLAEARGYLGQALAIFREIGHKRLVAETLVNTAPVAIAQGDLKGTKDMAEEGLALYRKLNKSLGVAEALVRLGLAAGYEGDYVGAMQLLEESNSIYRELGNGEVIEAGMSEVGQVTRWMGECDRSAALFNRRFNWLRSDAAVYKPEVCSLLVERGLTAWSCGEGGEAARYLQEGLAMSHEMGRKYYAALSLAGLAGVEAEKAEGARGDQRCAALAGAAEAAFEAMGARMAPVDYARFQRSVAAAKARANPTAWERTWAKYQGMTIEEASVFALS